MTSSRGNGQNAPKQNGNSVDFPDFAHSFATNIQDYIQTSIKRAVQQETNLLRAEIEDLKAHVNALEVELKCVRPGMNGVPPKG